MKTNFVVFALLFLPEQLLSFSVSSGPKKNRLFSTSLYDSDLNRRVATLEADMGGLKEEVGFLREDIKDLSREMKEGNDRLSRDIKDVNDRLSREIKDVNDSLSREIKDVNDSLSREIKDVNDSLSREIKDVNDKFIPLYVFLAVLSTATVMANFKDFVAFFK